MKQHTSSTTVTEKEILTWKLSEEGPRLFSSDAVIDAYLKGKKDGLDEQQKALQTIFARNYKKSGDNTGDLFTFLKTLAIAPVSAHLKINSLFSFEVIVLLSEADFLSEEMNQVYNWCREYQNKAYEETYRICFNFIDAMDGFDFAQLKSDGFGAKFQSQEIKK